LLDTISTNLTHFFREPKHFDFLAKEALPEIIKRKGFSKNLRFWCAGCSSGEEAYSMAIAACETVGGMRKTDFKILATDISTKALASARDGIYEEKRLGAIPYGLKRRYFQKGENKWVGYLRVKKEIRNKISFQRLNFVEEFQLGELFDVIFCRNVMIYFHTQEKAVLVNRLYQQLAQGGYLFLGHSESLTSNKYGLKYIQPSIYKKT
jgi:chemotaxis protein methyltransferase CheR